MAPITPSTPSTIDVNHPSDEVVDLDAPWENERIVEIRTSGMKVMRGLTIMTGIYKEKRAEGERVFCGWEGLEGDEHDLTFHGGPDKAIHQYYPGHYPRWASEFPSNNGSFAPGGFGENLITSGTMNERNICIGDIVSFGPDVLLQVSLPRQPCFKLNSRFGIKGFAPETWRKSRTGWYYRVLKTGWIGVGDEVRLVERKWEGWTIWRVQEFLHRDTGREDMLEELTGIEEFGKECKGAFKRLLAKAKEKEKPKEKEVFRPWVLEERKRETGRVSRFVLRDLETGEGTPVVPGSYVRLKLPNGLFRSYSVVEGMSNRVVLGIAHAEESRGGSAYMHESLEVGSEIMVGDIKPSVPIPEQCSNHIFIVGGIGITAFLGHAVVMKKINYEFTIHFAIRSWEDLPFKSEIEGFGDRVRIYDKSKGERMDIEEVIKNRGWNTFLYTCGPDKMIEGVRAAAEKLGVGDEEIHYEAFATDVGGDPFTVSVKGDEEKKVVDVGEDESLLEALKREGWVVDSSCEVGNCGTCRVTFCEGVVEHRGSGLGDTEKKEGGMLSCVSRGVGGGHLVVEF